MMHTGLKFANNRDTLKGRTPKRFSTLQDQFRFRVHCGPQVCFCFQSENDDGTWCVYVLETLWNTQTSCHYLWTTQMWLLRSTCTFVLHFCFCDSFCRWSCLMQANERGRIFKNTDTPEYPLCLRQYFPKLMFHGIAKGLQSFRIACLKESLVQASETFSTASQGVVDILCRFNCGWSLKLASGMAYTGKKLIGYKRRVTGGRKCW